MMSVDDTTAADDDTRRTREQVINYRGENMDIFTDKKWLI